VISVLDANVAVRWFVDLPHKRQARAIVESGLAIVVSLKSFVSVGVCRM
jgi:hypothetical protein